MYSELVSSSSQKVDEVRPSRQYHLDSLRGIASVFVVMIHYFAAFYPYAIFGSQESYVQRDNWETLFFYPPFGLFVAGSFSVWLFFILSGYVLSYGYLGEPRQARKLIDATIRRPIRLGGVVLVTILLSAFLWGTHLYANNAVAELSNSKPWLTNFWPGDLDWRNLIRELTFSMFKSGEAYNPALWSIRVELYGSILIFFLMFFFGQFKYRLAIMLAIAVAFCFTNNRIPYHLGLLVGVMVADLVKNHRLIPRLQSKRVFSVILFSIFIYFSSLPHYATPEFLQGTIYKFLPHDAEFGFYPLIAALSLFLFVTINDRAKSWLSHPLLQFLGKISYALYAIHFLILGSVSSWLFLQLNAHLPYGLSFFLVLLSAIPMIILSAILMTKYVDQPSIKAAAYVSKRTIALGEKIMGKLGT
jgi:peptidoglycan/LPS O-acetylase OafA/YrhL